MPQNGMAGSCTATTLLLHLSNKSTERHRAEDIRFIENDI